MRPLREKRHWSLRLIFVQAILATLWSLYYSNFGDPLEDIIMGTLFFWPGYEPCTLCRRARILMYPLVIIAWIALYRKDNSIRKYIAPLAGLGIALEMYHYSLQKFAISTVQLCTRENPCQALEVNYLGFITIPFLCLLAFLIVAFGTRHLYRFSRKTRIMS